MAIILCLAVIPSAGAEAEAMQQLQLRDTVVRPDTVKAKTDTLNLTTTLKEPKTRLDGKVDYKATDSITLDVREKKAYLYRDAEIKYQDMDNKAGHIIVDFDKGLLTSVPLKDSAGVDVGKPEFTQGSNKFSSNEIKYNFNTKAGVIKNVVTQEGEGYLHGEVVKKLGNDVSNLRHGVYTTCNLEDPHFGLYFSRAKVIPNDKIVTGPAHMEIEGVPLPLVLPFGFFPNKKGQVTGLLIPTYGESRERGFYLENGGYYLGINEYMDIHLLGDVYSKGSWAIKPRFNYMRRYKYTGSLNLQYAVNKLGVKGTSTYNPQKDFRIQWSHSQDPKSIPGSQFSASVNFGTRFFNKFNPVSTNDHLTNTFGSSISYATRLFNFMNMTMAATHSQNTSNGTMNITLPNVVLTSDRFYPFRARNKQTDLKWYDNISVNYTMNAVNDINTYDSLLFAGKFKQDMRNGILHSIPASLSLKILKYFQLNNSLSYNERWVTQTINERWSDEPFTDRWGNIKQNGIVVDTINGFKAARDYRFSSTLNTTIYGLKQFTKGPLRAIRHVMRPNVSFNYQPDFAHPRFGYYKTVQVDESGREGLYSIFGGDQYYSLTVAQTPPRGEQGMVSLGISNNLEIKVPSKKDTVTGMKKVVLIENLSLSSSYNMAADSMPLSNLMINGYTTLFEKIRLNYTSAWSPYMLSSEGREIDRLVWVEDKRPFRFSNSNWSFGLNYDMSSAKRAKLPAQRVGETPDPEAPLNESDLRDNYIDWNNPWQLSFNYNFSYVSRYVPSEEKINRDLIQTLGMTGALSITEKWKVDFRLDYDFKQNKMQYGSFNILRDLHCWEMRFNWIPIGYMSSWNFYIRPKASILQDLKLTKKKDFRDN